MDIGYHLSRFFRRIHYFLAVALAVAAVGVTFALVLPPVFVAEARLLVESEQIPDELAASTVRTEATEQLQIIESRIMTRANLLELANRLQIYAGRPALPADRLVEDMRRRTTIARIGPAPRPGQRGAEGATLVRVAFEAPTPTLAAQVANEFVTLILQENVAMRTGVAGQTLEFFRAEVTRLEQDMSERRRRILAFQQENLEALPDSLDFRRSQQAAAQERLVQIDRETAVLRDRRARLVALYESTGRTDAAPGQVTPDERALQAARDELSAALALYSETHPQVRVLQARVAGLESRLGGAGSAGPDAGSDSGQDGAQDAAQGSGETGAAEGTEALVGLSLYEMQLADIDGQIAFMEEQRAALEEGLAALQATIEATPGNAIRLETLQRDYDNLRVQYDQAVANRARAETGDLIESLSKGERITVIEQAVPPREPDSPNRPLIVAGGAGMGFVLGLGLIVLLEMANRAIRRPVDLTRALGVTPIATLPHIRTPGEARRRTAAIAAMLLLAIVGIPAALWAVDTHYLPLDLLVDRALAALGLDALIEGMLTGTGPAR